MSDETPLRPGEDTPEVPDTPRQPTTPFTPGAPSSWPTAPSSRRYGASGDGSDLIDLPRTAPAFRPFVPTPAEPAPKTDEPVAPKIPQLESPAQPESPALPETPMVTIPAGRPILKSRRWTPSQSSTTPTSLPEDSKSPGEPASTQGQPTIPDAPKPDAAAPPIPVTTPAASDVPASIPAPEPVVQEQAQPADTSVETTETPASTPVSEQTPETQLGDGGSGEGGGELPPTPPNPEEGEPEDEGGSTPEAADEVIAEGDTLVETEEKPEKKKRKGLVWFILAAILIIIAIILLIPSCWTNISSLFNPNSNPSNYPTDMESHLIVPEDPAILDPEFQKEAAAVGDVYQGGFVIDSVGLNVPLGEVSAVDGVLNPPGFDRAYVVRNMGVLPANATQGTVYVVLHTIVNGKGPGNFLIDPPKQTTTLRSGDLIKVGNLTYKFTGFRLIPRDQLSAHPDLWTSEPNRLIIITCMLHPDININTITENMVIFGELVS